MRKLSLTLILFLLIVSLVGCNKATQTEERNILMTGGGMSDINLDLSTIEKIKHESDLIIMGEAIDVKDAKYSEVDAIFISSAKIKVEKTFLGDAKKFVKCQMIGGYIPYREYIKSFSKDEEEEKLAWSKQFSKKDKEIGYIVQYLDNSNLPEQGKKYILFLKKGQDGQYDTIGTYHGIMEIDGEYINHTQNGKEYMLADMLEQL